MLDLNKINENVVKEALLDDETRQLIDAAVLKMDRLKQNMSVVQDTFSRKLTFAGLLRLKEILEISRDTLVPLVIKLEEKKLETIEKLCNFNNG